jgi:hypothetical protein
MSDYPLTAGDLRALADALDPIEFHEILARNPIVGRIEVYRPDGDDVVGYFERNALDDDAWLGFVPEHPKPHPFCPDCGHAQHSLHLIHGRDMPSTSCTWAGCGCTG